MFMLKAPQLDRKGEKLEKFIADNNLLLAALAVFAALIGMSAAMTPKWLADTLSFVFIAGLVLIWLEVLGKMPEKVGGRLFLFRYVLLWGVGGVVFYWLYAYRIFWDVALWFPMTLIILYVAISSLLPIIRTFRLTRWIFGIDNEVKTWWQNFIRVVAVFFLAGYSFVMGVYLSVGTNVILDTLVKLSAYGK